MGPQPIAPTYISMEHVTLSILISEKPSIRTLRSKSKARIPEPPELSLSTMTPVMAKEERIRVPLSDLMGVGGTNRR